MSPTVAIVAQGTMGAGVAQRLAEHKVTVLTSLAGRSEKSAERARAAGMRAVDERQLAEADFFLSIVPPGEALALAKRLAPALTAANKKPTYVDCNAVSPATMRQIADVVRATGCALRRRRHHRPAAQAGLDQYQVLRLRPGRGRFRAAQRLRADRARARGRADRRLRAENVLCRHHQGLHRAGRRHDAGRQRAKAPATRCTPSSPKASRRCSAGCKRQVPSMYPKAYRWVAELDEIAGFVGEDRPEHEMLAAAARLYERIAADVDGENEETGALDAFLRK